MQIDVVVEHKCELGESPVWDDKRKAILWIDILKEEVHEYGLENETHKIIPVHEKIGALALCNNGNFVAALINGFAFINRANGEIKMIVNPEAHLPDNRFNEGKCDPAGRFLSGTMSLYGKPKAGSLYVLDQDMSVTKKMKDISISNGMAWSLDHQTFYYIDTPTLEVASFDYNKGTGSIRNKKQAIKIPMEAGYPDGMTIDNEGMLWIAHWDGWQITRWNPYTGNKIWHIKLPVAKVTSCTFGGENLQDMYITTAKTGLTDGELIRQPLAGSLFVIRNIGFTGIQPFEFEI
jgi:sugar lactone lactonase YvrE